MVKSNKQPRSGKLTIERPFLWYGSSIRPAAGKKGGNLPPRGKYGTEKTSAQGKAPRKSPASAGAEGWTSLLKSGPQFPENKKTGGERCPRLLACCVCTMLIRLFYSSAALDSLLTSLEAELSLLSTALLVSELLSSLAEDSVSEAEEAPLRVLSLTKEESFTVFMAD